MLLSTRIVIAACMALLGVSGLLLGASHFAERQSEKRFTTAVLAGNDVLFKKIVNGQQVKMRTAIRGLTRNREAKIALRAKNPKELKEATLGLVNRLTADGTIDRLSVADIQGKIIIGSETGLAGAPVGKIALQALETRKVLFGVTLDPDGKVVLNVATPVLSRGKPIGIGIFGRSIDALMREFSEADNSHAFLVDSNGSILASSNKDVQAALEATIRNLGNKVYMVAALAKGYSAVRVNTLPGLNDKSAPRLVTVKDVTASVIQRKSIEKTSYAILAALIIATCGLLYFYLRRSFAPLGTSIGSLKQLAAGDLSVEVDVRSNDEIGALGNAINRFKEKMQEAENLREEQKQAEVQAQKLEKQREDEKRKSEQEAAKQAEREAAERQQRTELIEALIAEFDEKVTKVLDNVGAAASQMQESAETMSKTADHTSQRATAVAGASDDATNNVQVVAAAAEELSASIGEINRQVKLSNDISQNAIEEAQQTNEKVEGLADAAVKIGEVVSLINDIASQTNLLALNATIEAARAGDAGKGFAVVASEVKSLATQTSKATEEIGSQITSIQSATTDAVDAIKGISSTISQIGEIAGSIATAVDEQGDATKEIANNVQRAAAGTQEVSANIADVNQAAGESQAVSSEMLEAARSLAQQGEVLRAEVDQFLGSVRAA